MILIALEAKLTTSETAELTDVPASANNTGILTPPFIFIYIKLANRQSNIYFFSNGITDLIDTELYSVLISPKNVYF